MITQTFGWWAMILLLLAPAPSLAEKLETLPVTRIAPNTYAVYGHIDQLNTENRGFNGNAGFIVTDDGVVVIDALGTPLLGQRLLASIRRITDKPVRYLILTHNHPDHSYGASALKDSGATVIAHAGTQDYLRSSDFESSVAYREEILPQDMRGFRPIPPDKTVEGALYSKQIFRLGKHDFEVYNADHHHSFGDLVIRQLPENILWIGDLAFNGRVTYIGDGHSAATLKTIDWLRKNFPDTKLMVPGHGKAQRPPFPMLQQTYSYVERLRTAMRKAVERGETLESAVANCDLPDWQKVRLYSENHRKNCSFIYQEMEQETLFPKD